ncbi:hypothetical protein C10C_1037 [Chlamydia serpentis]|uniref:Lipoprotein n=1 Tax=Chlamydia serpentis TaxID=1967782 RepID=A0A2R8FCP2_9CHLA|nr:hypothetical protein [Chlamydia serpentis]SPN74168.1 hypothetical protein C10C_1037 [Chlamydia serpentis]
MKLLYLFFLCFLGCCCQGFTENLNFDLFSPSDDNQRTECDDSYMMEGHEDEYVSIYRINFQMVNNCFFYHNVI